MAQQGDILMNKYYVPEPRISNYWSRRGSGNSTYYYPGNDTGSSYPETYYPQTTSSPSSSNESHLIGHLKSDCGIGPLSGGAFKCCR